MIVTLHSAEQSRGIHAVEAIEPGDGDAELVLTVTGGYEWPVDLALVDEVVLHPTGEDAIAETARVDASVGDVVRAASA